MTIQQTMTQNIEYEIVQENDYNSFNVDEMRCAFFPRPLHCHPEYEITLIKEGEGFCFAGDGITLMRPMHIYFFGTNLPHFFKSDNSYYLPTNRESCHSIFTQFKEEVLPAGYKHMPGCKNIRALLKSGMEGMEWDISHHPRICQLVQDMLGRKGFEKLQARVPLKEMSNYSTSLSSITGGRASFTMRFSSYELVPSDVQEKLLKAYEANQSED